MSSIQREGVETIAYKLRPLRIKISSTKTSRQGVELQGIFELLEYSAAKHTQLLVPKDGAKNPFRTSSRKRWRKPSDFIMGGS